MAEALIAQGPDRHDEHAAVLAGHFELAGNDLEAARWQLRAAIRLYRSDLADARRRLDRAIDHLEDVPPGDDRLRLGIRARQQILRMGSRRGMPVGEADEVSRRANQDARELGDPTLVSAVVQGDLAVRLFRGDVGGAREAAEEALRWANRSGDRGIRAWVSCSQGVIHTYVGDFEAGFARVEEGIKLCGGDLTVGTDLGGYSVEDYGSFIWAIQCVPAGRLVEAAGAAAAVRARFELRPVAEWIAWTLTVFAQLADATGEVERSAEAERAAAEALRIARETGSVVMEVKALSALGVVALLRGRSGEAEAAFVEGLTLARDLGVGLLEEPVILAHRARARLALGDAATARSLSDEAVLVAQRQGAFVSECQAHTVRARVWRETSAGTEDLARAQHAVTTGAALAARVGAETWAAFLAEEQARLDGDRGALAACVDGYEAIGATGHAARLRAELAG